MPKRTEPGGSSVRVVGYLRVSTQEQALSGAGIAAQRRAIDAFAGMRGWAVVGYEADTMSGKSMDNRDGLEKAIATVEAGQAEVIVIARLDRLIRSVADFAALLERSKRRGWGIVALDLAGVDTTTPTGEFIATVMAAVAQLERRVIGERTRLALAERIAAGQKVGRPASVPRVAEYVVARDRRRGCTNAQIARRLTRMGIATPNGGPWAASTIRRIVERVAA